MTVVGHIGPSSPSGEIEPGEMVPGFEELGILAFTTTKAQGDFALHSQEQAARVFERWEALGSALSRYSRRLAIAHQVHGDHVVTHGGDWSGWLRHPGADAHVALNPGTALAVTIADCVPVFIAHPGGAIAIVHSGWRGTVANITGRAIDVLVNAGLQANDLVLHCGPSICGRCYEVSPDVFAQLTGKAVSRPTPIDLRALIAGSARAAGVTEISISESCTRCHNESFFSHRCGDAGRQLGVIVHR